MRSFPFSLCLTFMALAMTSAAHAYEDDVHYGLTNWLARISGFSPAQAETIARADVDYDHSGLSAIRLVWHASCFGRDAVVSREVKRIHFPSEAQVPSEPAVRRVDPGSDAAKGAYLRVVAVPAHSEQENLVFLGQALHPLQDSWSHQGIPDSPLSPVCDATLSWGHPLKRGGWRSHQADIAHRYVNDGIAMAEATYGALCDARAKLFSDPCQRSFNSISDQVLTVLQLNTKEAKSAWFRERGFGNPAFLDATSVPDGATRARHEPVDYATASLSPIAKSSEAALPNSPEAIFLSSFFRRWMTGDDVAAVVKEYVALGSYRRTLGSGDPEKIGFESAVGQLMFWRVRDHGLVQQALEGNHDLITSRLQSVPSVIRQRDERYSELTDALLPLDASGLPIATWKTRTKEGVELWVGAVRLRHAPNELVTVVVEQVGGRPQVVSINSTVLK